MGSDPRDAALKLQGLILRETDMAMPMPTDRARVVATFGRRPGTLSGEVARNTFLWKTFAITIVMAHLRRAAFGRITGAERAKYVAHLIIGSLILGTLGEQLFQIANGRDPLPLDDPRTLGKGLARGGGLAIFGDFLFSDQNRFGGGILDTLAGPIWGDQVPQVAKLTLGNLQELILAGEAKRPGRELTRFVRRMTPAQSLWYARLAMERLVFDELEIMADPDYADYFRRIEDRARREYGQKFWSPPGSGLPPPRAPDLGAALGESRQ